MMKHAIISVMEVVQHVKQDLLIFQVFKLF